MNKLKAILKETAISCDVDAVIKVTGKKLSWSWIVHPQKCKVHCCVCILYDVWCVLYNTCWAFLSFLSCLYRKLMILSLNTKKKEYSQLTKKTYSMLESWKFIWEGVASMLGRWYARLRPILYKEILFFMNQILPSILISIKSPHDFPNINQDTFVWFFGQVCLKDRQEELFEKLKSF